MVSYYYGHTTLDPLMCTLYTPQNGLLSAVGQKTTLTKTFSKNVLRTTAYDILPRRSLHEYQPKPLPPTPHWPPVRPPALGISFIFYIEKCTVLRYVV